MKLKKPLTAYKAVFFDVGDTLLTIPEARMILHKFLAERSLHRNEETLGELFQEAFQLFYYNKQLDESFPACSPESDRVFWMDIYRYMLNKLDVTGQDNWTEERIHAVCHELYDVFTSPAHYALFEDVKPVLAELAARGFRLAIVSNFAPTLVSILEDKGIASYFDPIIVSTVVGLEKPDPAIFRLALDQSGLSAEDVLYVGDHERNDLWAPGQVGIDAIRIMRYDYQTGEGMRSLRELLEP
ncbi:HAD-IA family hydrolase [Paenibacillus sp. YYML68]|uniref:HAD-IA family hydrolase n=1 Tax=Paenibacillus sp. YYML68 TaxID=2909250 RepID=UPI0024927C86|nr:HAD-IA family hydrolase [Paenibacillus sp. YYML68]